QVMQSAAPADRAPDHVAAFDRLALVLEHRGFQPNDPSTMASEFRFDRSKLPPADREAYFSFGSAPPVIVRLAHQENTRNRSVLTADVIWFATPDGEEVQRALANDTSDLIQVWWAKYRRDRSQEQ
ncbi:MAG: hypothetical protein KDC38_05730, partial [Planctomycetes bacterium]|nr:hypothetical protein [Planctomycetota bacterium]